MQLQQMPNYYADLHFRSHDTKECADCGAVWPCSGATEQVESIRACGVVNNFWYLPYEEMLRRYAHGHGRVRTVVRD
jgi:hypothetical protein